MIYLILLIGIIFRLTSLNQSLWLDEATTAIVTKMPIMDFFTKFMPADFHPPLYYLTIHYWSQIFGTSEISLRAPSVVFGILTIYCVYSIARELKFKWPLIPALLLATSGLHIYYSQEARMYAMATWLVSFLELSYIKKNWITFSIILVLIFLTDYLSLLILPALLIYSIGKNFKKILICSIPLIITFVAWLPIFINQINSGLAVKASSTNWWNILGPVTLKNILLIPTKFIIGRVSIDNKIIYTLMIALLLIFFGYVISKAKNKSVWSWFMISLILGIVLSFYIPTLTYFRYLFILPAFYLLLSENINRYFVVIILIINLITSGAYLFNSRFHRENWRAVADEIDSSKIIFPVNSQKEALIYYSREKQIINIKELPKYKKEVYLSRYIWEIFDPTDSTRLKLIDMGYNMISEANYNGVVIQKYENSN